MGIVTDTALSAATFGVYANVLPRSRSLSTRPDSAPSVHTLIIAVLLSELFQCGSAQSSLFQLQFKPQSCKDFRELGKPQLSKASVFQCLQRSSADVSFLSQLKLGPFQAFALLGDALTDCEHVKHYA